MTICAQTMVFKGYTIYSETHDTIPGVKLQVIHGYRDTLTLYSDKSGFYSISVTIQDQFMPWLECADPRYMRTHYRPDNPGDTLRVFDFYLMDPEVSDYFQEFLFDPNSFVPLDTNMYYAWDMNEYSFTWRQIVIVGYYAPGEKKSIGKMRAQKIKDGLVARGATADAFIIEPECRDTLRLSHGYYVKYKDTDYFFPKGLLINKSYIDSLTGDKKEAAAQLLRAVRFKWYQKIKE